MTKRVGSYELREMLGQGAFGIVRSAVNLITKEEFAIKIIDKDKVKKEDLIDSLKREIQILMMIDHPNIVRLIEVLASKTKIYLVLEWVKGGELFDFIRKNQFIPEALMRKFFRQIVRAISYCQSKQIAHRDLKPENILICGQNELVKVNDFGLSSLYQDSSYMNNQLYTTCGTVHYLAPEVIQSSGYDGHKADIWSLGVILYFSCAGYLPFENENVAVLLDSIISGAHFPFPKTFSNSLKDLISKILVTHPNKRITLEQIVRHPWFLCEISAEEQEWFTAKQDQLIHSMKLINAKDMSVKLETSSWNQKWLRSVVFIRKLKGLELVSFMAGRMISQLPQIKAKDSNFDSCFTKVGSAGEICQQTIHILMRKNPLQNQQINQQSLKIQLKYKTTEEFDFVLEFFHLNGNKFLITLKQLEGSLDACNKFLKEFQTELLHI